MNDINLLKALSDNIVVDMDKCIFCGTCVNTCILDNLRMKESPCRLACPLKVNVQGYVQEIARGREEEARKILRETLIFPGVLGRICTHPCEDNCHCQSVSGQAVSIRALKRYLAGDEEAADTPLPEMAEPSGKKVAIIGAGPAGLQAAHDLRVAGHEVVVFESEPEPGGMLRWAIPEFRLPQAVLSRELGLLTRMGIQFRCGVKIGQDVFLEDLRNEFDAVVVAAGCGDHARLNLDGEDLKGVYHGLPLLRAIRAGQALDMPEKVVVIGGGNVAVDAAQSALRLGARSVTLVSLEARALLPALDEAVQSAVAEGVEFLCSFGPVRLREKSGRVAGVELQRCLSVFDCDGAFKPVFDLNDTAVLEAEAVIVAIGQGRELSCLAGGPAGDPVNTGAPQADSLTLQTTVENLFLAGDFYSGPSSVVQAMASGRQAAVSVDRFLKGEHLAYGRRYQGPIETEFAIDASRGSEAARAAAQARICAGKGDFGELETTLDQQTARQEAGRCYSCGSPFGKYRTCWFCLPCEVECPNQALWVEIPYLLR